MQPQAPGPHSSLTTRQHCPRKGRERKLPVQRLALNSYLMSKQWVTEWRVWASLSTCNTSSLVYSHHQCWDHLPLHSTACLSPASLWGLPSCPLEDLRGFPGIQSEALREVTGPALTSALSLWAGSTVPSPPTPSSDLLWPSFVSLAVLPYF